MKTGRRITLADSEPHQLSEFFGHGHCLSVTLQSRGANTGIIEFGSTREGMVMELATFNGLGQSSLAGVKSHSGLWIRATVPNDIVNITIW